MMALLSISLFSALGLALALSSSVERLAATNHDEAITLLNAADAGLELALQDLAAIPDWNTVLSGTVRSTWVDGPPSGPRTPSPLVTVDLTRLTNELTCGRPVACTDAQIRITTSERPWGANNPRWWPFVHANLTAIAHPRQRTPSYVVVWVGDDGSEVDGNYSLDGGGPGGEGRYILRVRSEAFGGQGARRAIEAVVARICTVEPGGEVCSPGIRVQSWRVVTADVS